MERQSQVAASLIGCVAIEAEFCEKLDEFLRGQKWRRPTRSFAKLQKKKKKEIETVGRLSFCRQISCGKVFAPNFYSACVELLIICLWVLPQREHVPHTRPARLEMHCIYASNYETNRWASFAT